MFLYDSRTAQKLEFSIPTGRPVTMYVCGVTPYDTAHIGHARTYLIFDVLLRYLRWHGAEVHYCQNVTDVDDPLFERARRVGVSWRDLAEREVKHMLIDFGALNILPPTFFPRASEEIDAMIPIIARLLELGHAYVRDGNVYFRVRSDPDFGAMTRMGYDEMLQVANERGNNPSDPRKEDPLDFVLWQTSAADEPHWESPWGPGRPGWHIECSAMSTTYLGPQIDIHGGGRDLLFPHHPCEIAQTEPVTGLHPFVHVWMHAGLVWLDGNKMSKSLGNLVFVRDALREHSPDALRWYLLTQPYRDDFDYRRTAVEASEEHVQQLRRALVESGGTAAALDLSEARAAFDRALADDLNTPLALNELSAMISDVLHAAAEGRNVSAAQGVLAEVAGVLGLRTALI